MYCFHESEPDSRPPPVSFSPPKAPPISAPDVPASEIKLDLQPTKLTFSGRSTTKNVTYKAEFEFYEEIDVKASKINHTDRDIEMVIQKKTLQEEFWPRLLKDKAKVHWLKTDFDKWVDEDEQDPNEDEDWMAKAGGGMGGDGGFEGIDFSKFGSGPGGPGGAMPQDDDDDEDLPDDDDEDMPALEGEEEAKEHADAGASKKIIEEVE